MNRDQLVNLVIKPMLKAIPKGYTTQAQMAIVMIIAHESDGYEYISQLENGPAGGGIQMERRTHEATWRWGDTVWQNALLTGIITREEYKTKTHPPFDRLLYDIRYNIFMARQRLFMKPEAFPNDAVKMSAYLKKHWNSVEGAAKTDSYLKAYLSWK